MYLGAKPMVTGYDHILFLFGVVFSFYKMKEVGVYVSHFAVGHSTAITAASAVAILVTVVLPAEYNIDPTGIDGVLGLAEMGEIKSQLAEEAEADRLVELEAEEQSSLMNDILGLRRRGTRA